MKEGNTGISITQEWHMVHVWEKNGEYMKVLNKDFDYLNLGNQHANFTKEKPDSVKRLRISRADGSYM